MKTLRVATGDDSVKAVGATVVTHEKPNPHVQRRVPIPNVCHALGVPYVDTFEMLRALAT